MLKNPIINAVLAAAYIVVIVLGINYFAPGPDGEDTILAPIAMLSLLVLSVATMGFLFFAEPVRMFVDGRKEEGIKFFLKTLATFALFVVAFLVLFIIFV